MNLPTTIPVIDNKPTVAYLWARTVPCQDPQCGATVPLLKTLWVCKKMEKILKDTPENRNRPDFLRIKKTKNKAKVVINGKRALKLYPDPKTKQVRFEIITPKKTMDVDEPTMSGATATCPFCESQQPTDYIKRCGREGKLKAQMTAVVYQAEYGKEYRPPAEVDAAEIPSKALEGIANKIPYGRPNEALPNKERHRAVGSQLPDYGFKTWSHLFTNRQLLTLMTFVKWTHTAREEMGKIGYSPEWIEAINGYLTCTFDRMLDFNTTLISWILSVEAIGHTFVSYTLPMTWDFSEGAIPNEVRGGYHLCLNKILSSLETICRAHTTKTPHCVILRQSATDPINRKTDAIVTDPPYYDSIPYSDISDFFYVWLRRCTGNQFSEFLANESHSKTG